jgi:hypothetical protein
MPIAEMAFKLGRAKDEDAWTIAETRIGDSLKRQARALTGSDRQRSLHTPVQSPADRHELQPPRAEPRLRRGRYCTTFDGYDASSSIISGKIQFGRPSSRSHSSPKRRTGALLRWQKETRHPAIRSKIRSMVVSIFGRSRSRTVLIRGNCVEIDRQRFRQV